MALVATAQHDEFKAVRRHLARGGRPTSLTEDTIDKLGDLIAETAEYIEDACQALGIPRRNYYNWLKQGERDSEQELDTPQARFWHTLKAAESQGLVNLGTLWLENPRDFAAFATRGERRAPDKWGKRGEDSSGPRVVVVNLREAERLDRVLTAEEYRIEIQPPKAIDGETV